MKLKNLNTYILILCLFSYTSCKESNAETSSPPQEITQVNAKSKSTSNSLKPRTTQRTTNKSRATTEIKTEFPYDIELRDENGKSFNSSEIMNSDKPTIVLFWLTTCPPCKIELREIKKKYEGWQKEADFNLFAISTDFPKNYDNFCEMVKTNDWPWPAYNDVNREFRKVMPGKLNGLPQSFVFNQKGEIVYHKRKYRMGDEDKLFEEVKSLLN